MSLSNLQHDQIQRQYDARQLHNYHVVQKRKKQIYEKYPRLKELEEMTASSSVQIARKMLEGDKMAFLHLKNELAGYRKERLEILASAGLDETYFEPPYTCEECKDTGYVDGRRCHCFEQAAVNLIYGQSNIMKKLKKENFDKFSFQFYSESEKDPQTGLTARRAAQDAVSVAMDFIKNFSEEYNNLFITGKTGTGKTFLINCIAKELMDLGYSVIYFTAFRLFDVLENLKFKKKIDSSVSMKDILTCDLLVIDDLGSETANAFTVSQLYACLNERILYEKPTLISTNLDFTQMNVRYSERITSRIMGNYTIVRLLGKDIRMKKNNKS